MSAAGGPAARSAGRAAATLVVAWVVILGAVLALGWLITHPLAGSVEPWDDDAVRWFAGERTAELNDAAEAGTFLGETVVGVAVATVVAAGLSLWRRTIRPAAFFALLLAGIGGIYGLATMLVTRVRPPVRILDPGLVPDDSFPSGHVGTAIAVYGGTAVLVSWLAPRTRPWIWALLLVPVAVALARLYQGAHHPTDELASLLYTVSWMAVVSSVLLRGRAPERGTPPRR